MSLQTLKGMQTLFPEQIQDWQMVENILRSICARYGCKEIRTPILEPLSLFVRSVGQTSDVVQKEMFAFTDQGGVEMCARPEGTAPIVRSFLDAHLDQQLPITKLFYMGPMFRHERPQKGRLRQFHQFGIEVLGKKSPALDVEVLCLLWSIVEQFELPDPVLEINSLGDPQTRTAYRKALQDYFQPFEADLSEHERTRLKDNPLRLLDSKNPKLEKVIAQAPPIEKYYSKESKAYFNEVQNGLKACNIEFIVNPKIVRGLDYYSDTAFELKVSNLGAQNTIIAGGRYDGLSTILGGKEVPGIGFAMGLERLMLVKKPHTHPIDPSIVVFGLSKDLETVALQMAQDLRKIAEKTSIHFLADITSLKAGLRAANKYNAAHVLIMGEEENQSGQVLWKNFNTQEQTHIAQNQIKESLKTYL